MPLAGTISCGTTRQFPELRYSLGPENNVLITGTQHAIASRLWSPNPSLCEVFTNAVSEPYQRANLFSLQSSVKNVMRLSLVSGAVHFEDSLISRKTSSS